MLHHVCAEDANGTTGKRMPLFGKRLDFMYLIDSNGKTNTVCTAGQWVKINFNF